MYKYETHLHTYPVSACGHNTPQEMVQAYKDAGYTGFIITNHFFNGNTSCPANLPWAEKVAYFLTAYHEAREEAAKLDFDVFPGWEYNIQGTEFLTYGLTEDFLLNNPDCHQLDIEAYAKLVRANGGYLAQAHPYRTEFWVKHPFPVAPHLVDGIEVYNRNQPAEANQKALDFATLHNLPKQSGSDAHSTNLQYGGTPGGVILKERAKTIHDIISAIKNHSAECIGVTQ